MKRLFALAAVPAAILASGVASANSWVESKTHAFAAGDAIKVGAVDEDTRLHVVVALKLRNKEELDNYISRMGTPDDLMFGRALSKEFVDREFGPDEQQISAVTNHLQSFGFTNIRAVGQLIEADATVRQAREAFQTDFAMFSRNGKTFYANTGSARIPAELGDHVLSVLGLSNAETYHLHSHVVPNLSGGFKPTAFPKVYGVTSSTPTASNTVIGIISEGNLTKPIANLSTFEKKNGITPVVVKTEGPGGTDTSGSTEWDLDSQDIVGMSGGVKTLIFYNGASLNDADLNVVFNLAVTDNTAKAINVSLGECETDAQTNGSLAAADVIFQKGVAQGQTFFVSAGDSGSAECGSGKTGQSFPAVSPYVTSVGGTTLKATTSGTYGSETVWSGTGGGPSIIEPEPSWQTSVSAITGGMRAVPDVGLDANPSTGAIIQTSSFLTSQVGGTSLSAPLMTAIWGRAESASGNTLGFAAPLIYSLAQSSQYSSTFHDVTSGSNGGYSAKTGWDYTTGWGSPNVDAFVSAIK